MQGSVLPGPIPNSPQKGRTGASVAGSASSSGPRSHQPTTHMEGRLSRRWEKAGSCCPPSTVSRTRLDGNLQGIPGQATLGWFGLHSLHLPLPPQTWVEMGVPCVGPASQGSNGGGQRALPGLGDFPEEEGLPFPSINSHVHGDMGRGALGGRKCAAAVPGVGAERACNPPMPRLCTSFPAPRLLPLGPPVGPASWLLCLHSCCFFSKEGTSPQPSKPNTKAALSRSFSRFHFPPTAGIKAPACLPTHCPPSQSQSHHKSHSPVGSLLHRRMWKDMSNTGRGLTASLGQEQTACCHSNQCSAFCPLSQAPTTVCWALPSAQETEEDRHCPHPQRVHIPVDHTNGLQMNREMPPCQTAGSANKP